MTSKYDFDYIVIGSGPAGSAAALGLVRMGQNVGLVEKKKFGGNNLNSQNIPFAVGRDFAHLYYEATHSAKMGLSGIGLHYNLPTMITWQKNTTKRAGGDNWEVYERAGVTCLAGRGHLIDAHTVAVEDKQYLTNKIILATGSKPIDDTIIGLPNVDYLTPENAFQIRKVPRAMVVVGGGAAGCETAEFLAELGAKVLILEMTDRILPHEDIDASRMMAKYLTEKLDIMIQTNAKVVAVEKTGDLAKIIFVNNGREKMIRAEKMVLATGSRPVTDYGLENVGVKYQRSGIVVGKNFATAARNIFAIGDAIGGESSTEISTYQGISLVNYLVAKKEIELDYTGFMRTIKTFPEIVQIGLTESELKQKDRRYKIGVAKLSEITAGKIYDFEDGFAKIIGNSYGKIIGATVMMPNAEMLSQELAFAVRHKISASDIANTPHAENNFNLAIKLAARRLSLQYKYGA